MEVSLLLTESQRLLYCLGLGRWGQGCVLLLCVSPCLMPARAFLGFLLAACTGLDHADCMLMGWLPESTHTYEETGRPWAVVLTHKKCSSTIKLLFKTQHS